MPDSPMSSPQNETIIAPATPPGRSAVALLRISGPDTLSLLKKVFLPNRKSSWAPWKLRTGAFVEPATGQTIDTGMAVWMAAPHSYTGEDSAEVTCHGSPLIVERLLALFIQHGARLAEPGDFTRRAFLNGKMDLTEAEAVCDVVSSETEASLRMAARQLAGGLARQVESLRDVLLDAAAEIEAHLDFPEEDIAPQDGQRLLAGLRSVMDGIAGLLGQGERGRRLREGARVVLVGRANVGKSSLFNAMVGAERAIITPHPGTTRDSIEARLDLRGLAVNLVDTAGIRETGDEVERAGIERSIAQIEQADLVVWVLDGAQALAPEDHALSRRLASSPVVAAVNKADLLAQWELAELKRMLSAAEIEAAAIVSTSATTRSGLRELESEIVRSLMGGKDATAVEGTLVSNVRHLQALLAAMDSLTEAVAAMERGESLEFVATDLTDATRQLSEILGMDVGEEVLDRVFRKFCLGK